MSFRSLKSTCFALAFGMLAMAGFAATTSAAEQPNIVLILADDLGWSDTTLYGTTELYETPNIERLARRGMTFTRAYADSPLCSPTRAAVLTGQSPARTGITTPNCHLPRVVLTATPGDVASPTMPAPPVNSISRLDTRYYTLAEALKDAGYTTGHFGKWHLGSAPYSALQHGFDVDIPNWHGPGPAGSFVAPWKYKNFEPRTPDEHIEDRMADEAVAFMEKNRDEPFFLNYWMFSVHAPFDAKKDLIEKYRGRVDRDNPQCCPTYAAMVESMDDAVGTLLDALDRLGVADNTIIIFASDNGGNMYNWVDETTPTSNAPLRGGKATIYEGGVRGPAAVVWPGKVAANTRSDEVIQTCDYYPTILEMIDRDPQPNQVFDGISILPALEGKSLDREAIFTYFPHSPKVPDWSPPVVSVHRGDWKLIRLFHAAVDGSGDHRWKLFNLAEDIGETNDLAEEKPELVRELDELIEDFLVRTEAVRPIANPKFDAEKFDVDAEGKADPKGKFPRKAKGKGASRLKAPVSGWRANKHCKLSVREGKLVVNSTGADPYISYQLPTPISGSRLQLEVTMRSSAGGNGQLYWSEAGKPQAFKAQQRVLFDVNSDDAVHDYQIAFQPKSEVTTLRLDPAQAAGEIEIESMRVVNESGRSVYAWKFSDN